MVDTLNTVSVFGKLICGSVALLFCHGKVCKASSVLLYTLNVIFFVLLNMYKCFVWVIMSMI